MRVAIAEDGFDVTHPDLRRNISIHQGELPPGLFGVTDGGRVRTAEIAAHDCDPPPNPDGGAPDGGDGVISIRDMDCDPSIAPPDSNDSGTIDALDVLNDKERCDAGCWADGNDNDNNGFIDDLIGWDFIKNDNNPALLRTSTPSVGWHPTFVAGIIGAEGNNDAGIAGVNWRVSLVGLRTALLGPLNAGPRVDLSARVNAPAESVMDAFTYSENPANRIDVVNMSMGWFFERKGAIRACDFEDAGYQTTTGIGSAAFDAGIVEWNRGLSRIFRADGGTLYLLAGGNSGYDISDVSMLDLPFESMRDTPAVAERVLSIGALQDATKKAEFSSYGGGIEVFAPGVAWRSLIPSQYVCKATEAPLPNEAACSKSLSPCPAEGSNVVCYSDGASFSAPTVAGAAALLAAIDESKRFNGKALRAAILQASPSASLADCNGNPILGGVLNIDTLLTP